MLEQAKKKLGGENLTDRCLIIENNILSVDANSLIDALRTVFPSSCVSAVVSSLALHHYDIDEKSRAYTLAHNLLADGGVFIVTDLFTNYMPACAMHALSEEVRGVRRALRRGSTESQRACTTLNEYHYTDENKPLPLGVETQLLMQSGFEHVDIIYRSGQLAVVVAKRGGS
tara:strand:- start:1008 stop:1523 length:516 start_codon:yes stop_codon:yes gene_type:complete